MFFNSRSAKYVKENIIRLVGKQVVVVVCQQYIYIYISNSREIDDETVFFFAKRYFGQGEGPPFRW